jgi:nucleotidyltransferase/DNA polymerase involved in DNA repair
MSALSDPAFFFTVLAIPDFPVWAVRAMHPELRERELAVLSSGRVVACSSGLARMGVAPGQAAGRVHALAPEAVLRVLSGVEQRLAWDELLADLNRQTPWIQPESPGRACMRFAREEEAIQTATRLRIPLGQAGDRSTALLAALSAEEGQRIRVPRGAEIEFRMALPVQTLAAAGVGRGTLERLVWLGFERVGSLARLTREQLCAQFEEGPLLETLVRCQDRAPVLLYEPPSVVAVAHEFEEPLLEPAGCEPVLNHLLEQAVAGLQGRRASRVSLRLHSAEQVLPARRLLAGPVAEVARLRVPAWQAFKQIWPGPGFALSRLDLELGGLSAPHRVQGQLWPTRPGPEAALRNLEARFPGRMLRVVRLAPWSILPEEAAVLEPLTHRFPEGKEPV